MAEYISYNDLKVISPSPSSDTPARVVDDNFRIISDKFNGLKIVHHGTAEIIENNAVIVNFPTEIYDLPINLTVIVGGKGYMIEKTLDREGIMIGFVVMGQDSTKFDYIVISSSDSGFCEYITNPNPT